MLTGEVGLPFNIDFIYIWALELVKLFFSINPGRYQLQTDVCDAMLKTISTACPVSLRGTLNI